MRAIRSTLTLALLLTLPVLASAAIQTREIELKQGATVLKGFVAWDDAFTERRPGVLVVHEWWGHDEHARAQARRLAEAGYVGFALDLYGGGKVAAHPDDAQKFMAEAAKDPAAIRARFDAALAALKADSHVDPARIAAIGYCFGGGVVLNMARAGHQDLDAVVSFHGVLATQTPAQKGAIHARVLVLHGADDPMATAADVDTLRKELDAAGATYAIVTYPGAKHAFTNPKADSHGMAALSYNADADKRSWAAMLGLFKDVWR
jgi:dienelactone hydrolase